MDTLGSSRGARSGCILPYYNTFIPFPFFPDAILVGD
jgi:hypothetical protein